MEQQQPVNWPVGSHQGQPSEPQTDVTRTRPRLQPRSAASEARHPLTIVAGADEAVGLFVLGRIPEIAALPGGFSAIGVARGGTLVGGCVYTNYVPAKGGGEIQMWAAGEGWLSRRTLRVLLGYPFGQLGCHRITAIVAKKNRRSRRLVEGLGFKLEGVAREGMRPGVDACIYSLLKRECRWV